MDEKFKILSLDGGGVRGYLTAKILENIETYLNEKENENIPLGSRFDLIVGTSTGAIIGGLLAIGKSAKDIRKLYENDIPIIFSKNMQRNRISSLIWSKYKPETLIDKANSYFEELTFKDVKTDLITTAVDITTMTARLHKSDFANKNKTRANEKLSKAIIASASAPVFFPVATDLIHSTCLIDGGIVANNPSLIGIVDALTFDRASKRGTKSINNLKDILLCSVGTGEQTEIPYDLKPLMNAGGMDWLFQLPLPFSTYKGSVPLIEILMSSQAALAEFQAQTLLEKSAGVYKRINPKIGFKMKLDDASNIDKLKNIADLLSDDIDWLNKYFGGNGNDL